MLPADDALDGDGLEPEVTVAISGLSLYTLHGISEAEREIGQRLVFDITIETGAVWWYTRLAPST